MRFPALNLARHPFRNMRSPEVADFDPISILDAQDFATELLDRERTALGIILNHDPGPQRRRILAQDFHEVVRLHPKGFGIRRRDLQDAPMSLTADVGFE